MTRTDGHIGLCPTCGKRCYHTRKQARRIARRLKDQPRMSAYQCGHYWHIGHLPKTVINGQATRDDIPTKRRTTR